MTGKAPVNFVLRNNELSKSAQINFAGGNPQGCDAVHTGCDPRTACTTPPSGGVNCSCPEPPTAVIACAHTRKHAHRHTPKHMDMHKQVISTTGVFDGSLCELKGQVLDVFQKSISIDVFVPKPRNSEDISFLLIGQSVDIDCSL